MNKKMIKDIIFYFLIAIIFYIFAISSFYLNTKLKINIHVLLILFAILLSCIIFLLRQQQKDSFTFQLSPEKHCIGGPYMWQNEEKRKFCSQFTEQDIGKFSCNVGFHGEPINREKI